MENSILFTAQQMFNNTKGAKRSKIQCWTVNFLDKKFTCS